MMALLLSVLNINAQTDCPPSISTWSTDKYTAHFNVDFGYVGGFSTAATWASVEYQYDHVAGSSFYEIKINWSSFDKNEIKYNLTDEELKTFMYKAAIKSILGISSGGNCYFTGVLQFAFYEETPCKVEKACFYRLKQNEEILCVDDGYPGPLPTLTTYNGWKYYGRLTEYVECGDMSCCQVVYNVECINGEDKIVSIVKDQVQGTECPEGDNVRCLDNTPVPCTSTCE